MTEPAVVDPCENCGAARLSPLLCEACGAVAELPEEAGDFEVLGFAPAFEIDLDELEGRVLQLSALLHPDHHANALPHERDVAANNTARLNDAARRIAKPYARAEQLLQMRLPDEIAKARDVRDGLYVEMLETREEVDDIERADAMTEAQHGRLEAIAVDMRTRLDELWSRIGEALARVLDDARDEAARHEAGKAARRDLNEVRYYEHLDEDVTKLLAGEKAVTLMCRKDTDQASPRAHPR